MTSTERKVLFPQRRELIKLFAATAPAALVGSAAAAAPSAKEASTEPVPDARITAPLQSPANGEIRVAFVLSPDAQVIDFAGPWGVFENVWRDGGGRPFRLYTVAASRAPVRVSGGLTIVPDHAFADVPAPQVVVVPAMDNEKIAPAVLAWLRAQATTADVVMSVCNGSLVLGKAGLIDGKRVTAHHLGYGVLKADNPKAILVRGVRYVEDGRIATAGGLTCGSDLALRVVERYFGRQTAKDAAFLLEYQGAGWMYPDSNAEFAVRPVSTAEHPVDPVCGMQLTQPVKLKAEHKGHTYFFCSTGCRDRFAAAPARYTIDA